MNTDEPNLDDNYEDRNPQPPPDDEELGSFRESKTRAVCQECFRQMALEAPTLVKGSTNQTDLCSRCGRHFSGTKVLVEVETIEKPEPRDVLPEMGIGKSID